MKILGLDMVPLRVPLERRLQTFAVLTHTSLFIVAPLFSCIVFLYVLFSPLYYVALGYASWIVYDFYIRKSHQKGNRLIADVRRWKFWTYYRDYFPVTLVKTAELDPKKTYLMGYHPHGILGCGAFVNFNTNGTGFSEKFPGITPYALTLSANFRFPIIRAFLLWTGTRDVSQDCIQNILTKEGPGKAAVIVIGGAQEALYAQPGDYRLTLKNRKGFVKQAVKAGASLVPIFSFGENDLYVQASNPEGSYLRRFQNGFKQVFGISPVLFHGRGVFNYTLGLLPYRKPIHTVVGRPIDTEKMEEPTREIVNKYHKLYMEGLTQVFDEYKTKYGVPKEAKLIFT